MATTYEGGEMGKGVTWMSVLGRRKEHVGFCTVQLMPRVQAQNQ